MTVRVRVAVLAVEREFNSAGLTNVGVHRFQSPATFFEGHRLDQREIQVFGKPAAAKVAALECGSAFEGNAPPELAFSQLSKEPSRQ